MFKTHVRKLHDEIVCIGLSCCFFDFLFRRVFFSIANIFVNARAEENLLQLIQEWGKRKEKQTNGFLADDSNTSSKLLDMLFVNFFSTACDSTRQRLIEAQQKRNAGAFPWLHASQHSRI